MPKEATANIQSTERKERIEARRQRIKAQQKKQVNEGNCPEIFSFAKKQG